jgi:hypothetical protein
MTIYGESYLKMLWQFLLSIHALGYFQQDGALYHFLLLVWNYLDAIFPCWWMGKGGPLPWPVRSPDLNPCNFWLWNALKQQSHNILTT